MAKVKEAQMAKDAMLDNIQKLVLCGRAMLDAIEDLTNLYLCSETYENMDSAEHKKEQADGAAKGLKDRKDAEPERPQSAETTDQATSVKPARLEEVRGLLAEKSRSGFRAEVKALLTAHGVEKLSEITDPVELGRLLEDAGKIGAT